MRKIAVYLSVILLIILNGCIIIGGDCDCANNNDQEKAYADFSNEKACGSGLELVCTSSFGDITVQSGNVDKVIVSAHYFAGAKNKERAEELLKTTSIKFEITDKEIQLELLCPDKKKNESCGADFVVTVPAETATKLNDSYGKITVKGLKGRCVANSSFGAIEVEKIEGELDLSTSYGNIIVNNCTGDKKLDTSFKDIEVSDSQGEVTADTSYGKIILRNNVLSKVTLKTSFSEIEFDGKAADPALQGKFSTSYGKILLTGMEKYAGKMEMSTSYGEIKCDLPLTVSGGISNDKLSGKIGDGKGDIKISNSFGNITVK